MSATIRMMMVHPKGDLSSHFPKIALALLLLVIPRSASGQKASVDLTEASLEDLMNIEVTTVSSARGFNGHNSYSNKLLVLVDGRSIYSPINSGVFWDEQDTFLDNIERIEAIRGPGAALWGSNALRNTTSGDTSGGSLIANWTNRQSERSKTDRLFSGFVQDRQTIVPGRLSSILGSKFEHNDFTGVEIQTSARILFTPDSRHTLWAAVSREVRAPSMLEFNARANPGTLEGPGGIPILLQTFGSGSFRSEDVLAYDLGYRIQSKRRFSVDLSTYYNIYTHLGTYEVGGRQAEFFTVAPYRNATIGRRMIMTLTWGL